MAADMIRVVENPFDMERAAKEAIERGATVEDGKNMCEGDRTYSVDDSGQCHATSDRLHVCLIACRRPTNAGEMLMEDGT